MKTIILIQLLAAASHCFSESQSIKANRLTTLMSDGRQMLCLKGVGPSSSDPNRRVIQHSYDGETWTCDEIPPTDSSYLRDVKYPEAPINAKETGSFVSFTPMAKEQVSCSIMVPGDEAKLVEDNRYFTMTEHVLNLKFICTQSFREEI